MCCDCSASHRGTGWSALSMGLKRLGFPSCAETWGTCYNSMCPDMDFSSFLSSLFLPSMVAKFQLVHDPQCNCCPSISRASITEHESVKEAHRRSPPWACRAYFFGTRKHTRPTCRRCQSRPQHQSVSLMYGLDKQPMAGPSCGHGVPNHPQRARISLSTSSYEDDVPCEIDGLAGWMANCAHLHPPPCTMSRRSESAGAGSPT